MRELPARLQPEVVIVSPLRRTLETAVGIFGCAVVASNKDAPLLMTAMKGVPEVINTGIVSKLQRYRQDVPYGDNEYNENCAIYFI